MNIILMSLPGAGKGARASEVAKKFPMPHIFTGGTFRKTTKDGTDLGKEAKPYMGHGELVPDEVTVGIAKGRTLGDGVKKGFLLGGFPRTIEQTETLNNVMSKFDRNIDTVISIEVPEKGLVNRLTGRRICEECNTTYYLVLNPPKVDSVCDIDGGELYQRKDDNPETVSNRLGVSVKQSKSVLGYCSEKDVLKSINDAKDIDEVTEDVIDILDQLKRIN